MNAPNQPPKQAAINIDAYAATDNKSPFQFHGWSALRNSANRSAGGHGMKSHKPACQLTGDQIKPKTRAIRKDRP